MEKTFVVKKKTTIEEADGETIKLSLNPVDEEIEKIKLEIPSETIADKLGIPTTIGDTILIDFGKTNVQAKLDADETTLDEDEKTVEQIEEDA